MVLELAKGEIAQIVLNQLYKHTAMQSTFGVNMLALVGRRPQVVTLREMLEHFIDFRREVVIRRTRYDLARAEERAHILEGLRKALDHLDLVIRLIRGAASVDAAREALMSQLELSEIQAKAILDMRLQRLTQLEREKVVQEHTEVLQLIERLRAILASDALVRQIIKDEALALKTEYGDERRTEIVEESIELTLEDLIADEEMVVTVTRSGLHQADGHRGLPEPAPGRQGRHRHGDQGRGRRRAASTSPRPTPTSCSSRTTARSTGSRCTRFPRPSGTRAARRS